MRREVFRTGGLGLEWMSQWADADYQDHSGSTWPQVPQEAVGFVTGRAAQLQEA